MFNNIGFLCSCLNIQKKRLRSVSDSAEDACGKIGISGRYHCLPRRLKDDYEILPKVVGKGISGAVRLARNRKTGQECVVKSLQLPIVPSDDSDPDRAKGFASEVSIALHADHPHLARLEDVYESSRRMHLVMEYLSGGTLFDLLKTNGRFPEDFAAKCALQMLLAVNYLHKRGIVHRDLKLANFVFQGPGLGEGLLQLLDFGFSKRFEPGIPMDRCCGTMGYKAPEVLERCYTSQCDLWSMGVIVFRMLMSQMPFGSGNSKQDMLKRVRRGELLIERPKRWASFSEEARDFVMKLLVLDPNQRLTAEQALDHPWIVAQLEEQQAATPPAAARNLELKVARALCSHARVSRFRRACLHVATWALTDQEREKVVEAFKLMDRTFQGVINVQEVKEVVSNHLDTSPKEEVDMMHSVLDSLGVPNMQYSSLLAAMLSSHLSVNSRIVGETFRRFDVDRSGYITAEDLQAVLGNTLDGVSVEELLGEADVGRKGRISQKDFAQYMAEGCKKTEVTSL